MAIFCQPVILAEDHGLDFHAGFVRCSETHLAMTINFDGWRLSLMVAVDISLPKRRRRKQMLCSFAAAFLKNQLRSHVQPLWHNSREITQLLDADHLPFYTTILVSSSRKISQQASCSAGSCWFQKDTPAFHVWLARCSAPKHIPKHAVSSE